MSLLVCLSQSEVETIFVTSRIIPLNKNPPEPSGSSQLWFSGLEAAGQLPPGRAAVESRLCVFLSLVQLWFESRLSGACDLDRFLIFIPGSG